MKKSGSEKKEAAPVPPLRGSKAEAPAKGGAPASDADDQEAQQTHKLHLPNLKDLKGNLKGNCKQYCAIIFYVLLGVITIFVSLGVLVITSLASVAIKAYDADQSTRLVSMIVLAVTAAIALSMVIYAIIGAIRKHAKSVHATGVVLVILAVLQALVIGLAIKITAKDELAIGKSLADSFRLAKADNPRHVKLWTATQFDLRCCGVYSPEDYRDPSMPYYFPPNVPISCCPTFDPNKPPYNQERQREMCKVNGTFFDNGCKGLITEVFKETSVVVIGIIVVLIVFEVLLTLLGAFLNKKHKSDHDEDKAGGTTT